MINSATIALIRVGEQEGKGMAEVPVSSRKCPGSLMAGTPRKGTFPSLCHRGMIWAERFTCYILIFEETFLFVVYQSPGLYRPAAQKLRAGRSSSSLLGACV